jgi:hypothetical protein
MAPQSDQTIQNATFPNVRSDINDNLEALFTQSSGSSEPTTKVAFQPWVDTSSSPPVWKIRNAANSAWITVGVLDPAGFTVGGVTPIANGGTGQTTVAAAIAALLPSQSGNDGKALTTNGTSLLWSVISASSFNKYTFAAGSGTGTTRTHTWTKPDTGSTVIVLAWGGGGAGGVYNDNTGGGGGGGGGCCTFSILKLSDLSSTETITIGAGGAAVSGGGQAEVNGTNGTNTTFGSHVTGFGGRGGYADNNTVRVVDASTPLGVGGYLSTTAFGTFAGSFMAGGIGGSNTDSGGSSNLFGSLDGGDALFGGAGGGGCVSSTNGSGGTSFFAGDGGTGIHSTGNAGSTPAGGGGGGRSTSGKGGDGECWVMVF